MYNTLFEVFIVPMCDEGCSCVPEEDFSEEAKVKPFVSKESSPCAEGTCDCMGKEENYFKPDQEQPAIDPKEFDTLFTKYTEANKLILSLQKEKEYLYQLNKDIIAKNISLTKQRDEVYNALRAFEKRIASL